MTMNRRTILALLGGLAGLAASVDLTGYVLPKVGTEAGGNTFPGVSTPFGMVKLGPDLYTGTDSYSGYQPGGVFNGFSMLHESGTGGAPKYGVVSQMPALGSIDNPLADHTDTRASPDEASVGYYKASLGSGIIVELAATARAGLYSYTFPAGSTANNVIVDVSHVLPSFRKMGLGQNYLGGSITVNSTNGKLQYQGSGSYDNGWNRSPKWTVYFCGDFNAPGSFKTFMGTDATSNNIAQYSNANSVTSNTARLGAVFTFSNTTVVSRLGVSFISADQACKNVNDQIPVGTSLATVTSGTKDAWNTEILSKVTTTDTDVSNLQLLYTSLYHMNLLPTNKTGENPNWTSAEPYYDDSFTLWDLHRCTTPLFHILHPVAYEEFIRSLIDIYRHDGYMPDARSSFFNGATQGGSNADNILADAYVKGVRGQVNWADGYAAMLKDAEVTPPNNNDPRDPTASTQQGRGALPDWLQYGFITTNFRRSVTRVVEYSANDFGLSQVAQGLGLKDDHAKYLNRSRNWQNHWNPNAKALGFEGFLVPRTPDGFVIQDPLSCGGCYWGDNYYEALPWEYSFNTHHDMANLVTLAGGDDLFVKRLDTTFLPNQRPGGGPFNGTLFNPGNEPSFTTPYLYNFVNRPDRSVYQSRSLAKAYYHPTNGGLPGNSDAGAMESWVLWVMLGLYPLTGQTTFLIASPWFANLTISLPGGKAVRVTAAGLDQGYYNVQSLAVNGKPWTQSWLTYDDLFAAGGSLDFVLGPDPVLWATGPRPPSPASQGAAPEAVVLPEVPDPNRPPSIDSAKRMLKRALAAALAASLVVGIVVLSTVLFLRRRRRRRAKQQQQQGGEEAAEKGEGSEGESKGEAGAEAAEVKLEDGAIATIGAKRDPDSDNSDMESKAGIEIEVVSLAFPDSDKESVKDAEKKG